MIRNSRRPRWTKELFRGCTCASGLLHEAKGTHSGTIYWHTLFKVIAMSILTKSTKISSSLVLRVWRPRTCWSVRCAGLAMFKESPWLSWSPHSASCILFEPLIFRFRCQATPRGHLLLGPRPAKLAAMPDSPSLKSIEYLSPQFASTEIARRMRFFPWHSSCINRSTCNSQSMLFCFNVPSWHFTSRTPPLDDVL